MKDTQDLSWAEALREVDRLRAELGKAQEEKATALADQRRRMGAEFDEVSLELQDVRKKARARIKELELTLSGKTFSYNNDPEALKAARIAGMEEAAKITLVTKLAFGPATMEREAISAAYKAIRARISEIKRAA